MKDRINSRADYDRVRDAFRWECPDDFNFGFDVVDDWANRKPELEAIYWASDDTERRVTFTEMSQRSDRVAGGLLDMGLAPGDRVLVLLPRVVEWWESLIGMFKAGLVALPGTTQLTPSDLLYRAKSAEVSGVITDPGGAAKIDQIATDAASLKHKILVDSETRAGWQSFEELATSSSNAPQTKTRRDDPSLIYFTSGTTGPPKMVLHTHASCGIGHQITGRYWIGLQPGELHWNLSDTGWAKAAWSSLFGPWICGATLFVQQSAAKFQPRDVIDYLNRYPIATMCGPPTIFRMLVQLDLSELKPLALRDCVAAGEPLNAEVISTWKKATGITIRDGFGQTESVLVCGNFPGVDVRPGSMGLPSPGFDLAIVNDEGEPLAAGQEGDLAIKVRPERPVGLFREYYRDAEATAAAHRGDYYITGDRGMTDDDGYFWFVSRADDVITSSAYRIGPFEVESALLEHPDVAEAAVVGKPDDVRGQIVKAYVVLSTGKSGSESLIAELQTHVKESTAPYKYPREIEFVDALPKTISGKIRRIDLRERAANE